MTPELEAEWKKRRTRSFLHPSRQTHWGYFLHSLYLKEPGLSQRNNFFVKVHNGIGDQICVLGLLDSCRLFHKAENIIIVASKKSKELISFFAESYDKVILFDDIPPFEPAHGDKIFDALHMPSKAHILNGAMNAWFTKLCVPYVDQYRIGLSLPPDAEFRFPVVRNVEAQSEVEAIQSKTRGSVVLFPHSNTWPGPDLNYWVAIAKELLARNIPVFTNVRNSVNKNGFQERSKLGEHEPVPGTQPLSCSLAALLSAAPGWMGWLSGVSGPAFLLAGASKVGIVCHLERKISFGEGKSVRLVEIDSVKNSFPMCSDIHDIEFCEKFDLKVVEKVLSILVGQEDAMQTLIAESLIEFRQQ